MHSEVRRDTVKLGGLLSVAEQIQAFCLGRKTGEIYVTNVPAPARLNIVEGEIVDAQYGMKSGLEAALALINVANPQSEFIVGEQPKRRTINTPYIQVLCEAALAQDRAAEEKHRTASKALPLASQRPVLKLKVGEEVSVHPLAAGITSVGRGLANQIVVNEPTVSQRHASLEFVDGGVLLRDLGSSNGTYVDGQRIRERWLNAEDVVQFGSARCVFATEDRAVPQNQP